MGTFEAITIKDENTPANTAAVNSDGQFYNADVFLEVAKGAISGQSFIEKFGENAEIDIATAPEDIWSYGGLYTFSNTANIDQISSASASDTVTLTVEGLDTNWEYVLQTKALTGQTGATLDTPLIRMFRAWNSNSTDLVGDVYFTINGASLTNGVPDSDADVRGHITADSNQTEMCIYTVPAGKTGYFMGGYVSLSRVGINTSSVFTSRLRVFGSVFVVVSRIACLAQGRSSWDYRYPIPLPIPEKSDLLLRCDAVGMNTTGVSGGFTILLIDD